MTLWEITIKQTAGKLGGPPHLAERVRDVGFRELPVTHAHAIAAGRLPVHHRDPFDRMLVAQASLEGLTLAYLAHTLAALAAAVPYDAVVNADVVTAWLGRAAAVVLISAVLTVGALGLATELAGGAFVVATLIGLAGAVAATMLLARLLRR